VRECENTYLYTCTFKKHLQQAHKNEYDKIIEYEEDSNFHELYKRLKDDPTRFDFLNFKSEEIIRQIDLKSEKIFEDSLIDQEKRKENEISGFLETHAKRNRDSFTEEK
jgi:hypothetical protein